MAYYTILVSNNALPYMNSGASWANRTTGTIASDAWDVWSQDDETWSYGTSTREARDELEREQKRLEEREERSKALLRLLLSDEEWEMYEEHSIVRYVGEMGVWLITSGCALYLLSHEGEMLKKWCCHACHSYPPADRMAAALLELQADEAEVARKGNENQIDAGDRELMRRIAA